MIELKDISVAFQQDTKKIIAVNNVSLSIKEKEIFGIVGYSGAGKSTLVRVINLLQPPMSGEVLVKGQSLTELSAPRLRRERKNIGMIFQHFNLMNQRTVADNILFSLKYTKGSKQEKRDKVMALLDLVGIADKATSYPSQLSGGQKQRVAIARALVNDPEILLCDEATSALDPKTTNQILELLQSLNKRLGLTIVLITHEMQAVKNICSRVAVMENGVVVEENKTVTIFSQPKHPVTQEFIRTASHIDQAIEAIRKHPTLSCLASDEELLELSYLGEETAQPLIADLYSRFQVQTSILYGNIDIVQDEPIGHLIVTLKGLTSKREQALAYLQTHQVRATPLSLQINEGGE